MRAVRYFCQPHEAHISNQSRRPEEVSEAFVMEVYRKYRAERDGEDVETWEEFRDGLADAHGAYDGPEGSIFTLN